LTSAKSARETIAAVQSPKKEASMFETGRKRMRVTAIARRNLGSRRRRTARKLQRRMPDADNAAGGDNPF
jgi:hypothetical protein